MLKYDAQGPVLIAGGYGVVGSELATLLHRHHPELPLLLTGRHPARGAEVAGTTGAEVARWDLSTAAPPSVGVRAVVTVANDSVDAALHTCLAGGVPYVDVTRWTSRMQRALAVAVAHPPQAPVVLSSGWMGGLVPRLAGFLAGTLDTAATSVEVSVRYDVADRAGIDSVDFMDRFGHEFEAGPTGGETMVTPLRDVRSAVVGADRLRVARVDTPEQFTLPLSLGVSEAVTRLGFSAQSTTTALLTLRRLGFFRFARGNRLRKLRRGLLYHPGPGGEARLAVTVAGGDHTITATVSDQAGQAHLTAVGALLSLRDALRSSPGVVFPELVPGPDLPTDLEHLDVGVDLNRRAAEAAA